MLDYKIRMFVDVYQKQALGPHSVKNKTQPHKWSNYDFGGPSIMKIQLVSKF